MNEACITHGIIHRKVALENKLVPKSGITYENKKMYAGGGAGQGENV